MDLINGKALTFLRRALPEDLAPINQVEVALSMGDSFVATGLTIEDNLLSRAAKATMGYAYLVQLVGYSIWQRANLHRAKSAIVSERDVTEGIALAEVKRPMRSAPLGQNCYKERLFRHRRGVTCSLPCRTWISICERMPRRSSNGFRSRGGDVAIFRTAASVDCHIGFSGATIPVIIRCGIHRRPPSDFVYI